MVDGLAAGLLGRHVLRRAGDDAGLGQTRVVGGAGEAEVDELDALDAVLQQDVRRLDVAVDQPDRVRRLEPPGRLHADPDDLLDGQRAGPVDPVLERLAGDVLHDEVRQPARGVDGVDGDDVVVTDRRGGLALAGEPAAGRGARGQLGGEDLDRHEPIQRRVERLEDHTHPAAADDVDDLIRADPAEMGGVVGGSEEVEGIVGLRRVRTGRRRVVFRVLIRPEEGPGLAPPAGAGGHAVKRVPTAIARGEVLGHRRPLRVVEPVVEQAAEAVGVAVAGARTHGFGLAAKSG